MEKIPVLLDTDIGSDIDDAVALAYLLKHPRCDLLGITTVTGDTQKRAALAEAVCRAAGRTDIRIHCGCRAPLSGPGQPNVPQFDAIADSHPRLDRPENDAHEFLKSTIESRPGEIVLLTIGPLTNISMLFTHSRAIGRKLKSIVSMIGAFDGTERCEWNALVDPVAMRDVYTADRSRHISVGLNVTEKCRMKAADVRSRFTGEPLETVAKMAEVWFQQTEVMTFHDPLAAALVFHPEICTYESGEVLAGSGPNEKIEHMVFRRGPEGHEVAQTVDSNAFFEEYFRVVHGQ